MDGIRSEREKPELHEILWELWKKEKDPTESHSYFVMHSIVFLEFIKRVEALKVL